LSPHIAMLQSFTISQINTAAEQFIETIGTHSTIAFHGQMGAGKTTFINALCKALDVDETTGSPTYSIINQYKTAGGKIICHMDWYRLRDEEEAIAAGVEDALYSGNLCLVEWPEKAEMLLPADTLHVTIEAIDADTRKIVI
jgi:tRNA threonylcarbamoyladenosine biosynthesis protein TsaE